MTGISKKIKATLVLLFVILISFSLYISRSTSSVQESDPFWNTSNEKSTQQIDHQAWQVILDNYLLEDEASGINRFDYGEIDAEDRRLLEAYLKTMQGIDPREYASFEQAAYWINLYNALTIKLIADNYPVQSITKLGQSLASFGPWDDPAAMIAGRSVSLNDIEHRILRPIWGDARIHFAVNCASLGCPNLQPDVFSSNNLEALLNKGATEYLSHPRGLRFENGTLVLSEIFKWYSEDFGDSEEAILKHLGNYVPSTVKTKLLDYKANINYEYDWSLNDLE